MYNGWMMDITGFVYQQQDIDDKKTTLRHSKKVRDAPKRAIKMRMKYEARKLIKQDEIKETAEHVV